MALPTRYRAQQKQFRDPSDPRNVYYEDDDQPRSQPPVRHQDTKQSVRPEGVSENVWRLAEQWLVEGEKKFGKRPPVNKQAFAERFSAKINSTRDLRVRAAIPPEKWKWKEEWDSGLDFILDVISRMITKFFGHLTEDQHNTSSLQFDFLEDEWDEWVYQAITSCEVTWAVNHGTWKKSGGIYKPLDRKTIGRPSPESPCNDPNFPGMTWGEVWALPAEPTPQKPEDDEPEPPYEWDAGLTSRLRTILANRKTATTEED